MSKSDHTEQELEEMAKSHNMTKEQLKKHISDHENMEFAQTHAILLSKEFTDQELAVMSEEHGMTLDEMKEHIAMAKQHHSNCDG